ncbi:hypothetical protein BGZ52_000344 [Haplosporangium bisporale]|nr:hypothetical protein BGZ52_000344 [Haplosporangium bisporale]
MVFARTLVVLCVAAVAMAGSCGSQESFDSDWWGPRRGRMAYMMDGLRCKCNSSSMKDGKLIILPNFRLDHEIWTKNTCSNIGKEIKWCYNAAQDFCETGNKSTEFRELCAQRGGDCFAVDC